jgi:hypothetical protein
MSQVLDYDLTEERRATIIRRGTRMANNQHHALSLWSRRHEVENVYVYVVKRCKRGGGGGWIDLDYIFSRWRKKPVFFALFQLVLSQEITMKVQCKRLIVYGTPYSSSLIQASLYNSWVISRFLNSAFLYRPNHVSPGAKHRLLRRKDGRFLVSYLFTVLGRWESATTIFRAEIRDRVSSYFDHLRSMMNGTITLPTLDMSSSAHPF